MSKTINPDLAKLRYVCPELWELYLKAPPLLRKRLNVISTRVLELEAENKRLLKVEEFTKKFTRMEAPNDSP